MDHCNLLDKGVFTDIDQDPLDLLDHLYHQGLQDPIKVDNLKVGIVTISCNPEDHTDYSLNCSDLSNQDPILQVHHSLNFDKGTADLPNDFAPKEVDS